MGKAGKIVRLVRVMRIMRIFKLVRHFAGLQSLIYTLNQVIFNIMFRRFRQAKFGYSGATFRYCPSHI
jgi:hypothetical protein